MLPQCVLAISPACSCIMHKHYSMQKMRYHLPDHAAVDLISLLQRNDKLIDCNMPACMFGDGLDSFR